MTRKCSSVVLLRQAQAQDRIHRLGQYKPIHVVRFVIAGTIEERILKLQVQLFNTAVLLAILTCLTCSREVAAHHKYYLCAGKEAADLRGHGRQGC